MIEIFGKEDIPGLANVRIVLALTWTNESAKSLCTLILPPKRQTAANVVGHYARAIGITEKVGVANHALENSSEVPGFTKSSNSGVYVNAKGGGINSKMDDANNLTSVLIHEKGHVKEIETGTRNTLYNHLDVYATQMSDPRFGKATTDFQNAIVNSFANYIMNASAESYSGAETFAKNFNEKNKLGYKLYVDTSPSNPTEYSTSVYRNDKLVNTVHYKRITNEH